MLPPCLEADGCVTFLRKSHIYPRENFKLGWEEFKTVVGDLDGSFFLGTETLHQLTKDGDYGMKVFVVTHHSEAAASPCTTGIY